MIFGENSHSHPYNPRDATHRVDKGSCIQPLGSLLRDHCCPPRGGSEGSIAAQACSRWHRTATSVPLWRWAGVANLLPNYRQGPRSHTGHCVPERAYSFHTDCQDSGGTCKARRPTYWARSNACWHRSSATSISSTACMHRKRNASLKAKPASPMNSA